MEIPDIGKDLIVAAFIIYVFGKILEDIEKKRRRKKELPKPKMSREEIIQRERRRNRWARRKAQKHIKKDDI